MKVKNECHLEAEICVDAYEPLKSRNDNFGFKKLKLHTLATTFARLL